MKAKMLAFFDIDGTVINSKSMFSFFDFYWQYKTGKNAKKQISHFYASMKNLLEHKAKRETINQHYYQQFAGCAIAELENVGEAWWQHTRKTVADLFNHSMLEKIRQHQKHQFAIIAVSGSMKPCLNPILKTLHIETVLCSELEMDGKHKLTGQLLQGPIIGDGKAKAIKRFLAKNQAFTLQGSFGYGDHHSDIPMLKLTTHPHAINPSKPLAVYAKQHHWTIID